MAGRIHTIVHFSARLLVLLSSSLALLVAMLIGATQFQPTRNAALSRGLDALNASLAGKVAVKRITGNIFTGIALHDIEVAAAGTTFFRAPLIELRYQLSPIFRDRVIGARVTIHSPIVNLIRNARDSSWNITRVARPSTTVDTSTTPFPYTIDANSIEIRNGSILVDDKTVPDRPDTLRKDVDYSHLDIREFNLSAVARIETERKRLILQHTSFLLPRNDVRLLDLSTELSIDSASILVDDLRLETEQTRLRLDARIDSVDILGGDVDPALWQATPIALRLSAPRVATRELERFLPALAFLGGEPALELEGSGAYGDMRIDRLRVAYASTMIDLAGQMRNLHRPEDLFFDVRMADSRILPADVTALLPGIPLPDLSWLGRVDIARAEYRGDVRNFHGAIQARTAVGTIQGAGRLDLSREDIAYEADLALAGFDPAPMLGDPSYGSVFNGHLIVAGTGLSPQSLDARFLLLSNGSTVMGRTYRSLMLQGSYRQGGLTVIDTAVVVLGGNRGVEQRGVLGQAVGTIDAFIDQNPIIRLVRRAGSEIDGATFALGPSIAVGGTVDIRDISEPRYQVNIRGHRISLADFLPDASPDRFSFAGSVRGVGLEPDRIDGSTSLDVSEATMADGRRAEPFALEATLEQISADEKRFTLRSSIADIAITGEWRFTSVVQSLSRAVEGLINYAQRKASYRDDGGLGLDHGNGSSERVAAVYSMTLRDLRPLAPFLGGITLEAEGALKGTLSGTPRLLSLEASGRIDRLRYASEGESLSVGVIRLKTIEIRNLAPGYIDDITGIDIDLQIDSPFVYNDTRYQLRSFKTTLEEGVFRIQGNGAIVGQVIAVVDGVIDTREQEGYLVNLSNLVVITPGQSLQSVGAIRGVVTDQAIQIDTLVMRRKAAEVISVSGRFIDGERMEGVRVRVLGASVPALAEFASSSPFYRALNEGKGSFTTLEVDAEGTLENPRLQLRLQLDSLSFERSTPTGIGLVLEYADRNLSGTGTISELLHGRAALPRVAARIDIRTLPIDLAIASRTKRLLKDRPVDIIAATDSLPLSIFSPFLSGAHVSAGTLTTSFTVSGTLPDITYRGTGTVDNGRILLESTNIVYLVDGILGFTERRLTVESLTVRNLPGDLRDGRAEIKGYVNLEAFTPKDFRLRMEGSRLLVLSDATQGVNNQIYGDLVIAIPELTFSGPSFAAPMVSGSVTVIEASLKAEQAGAQATINPVNYVDYGVWVREHEEKAYGPEFPPQPVPDTARRRRDPAPDTSLVTMDSTPPGVDRGFYDRLEIRNLIVSIREGVLLTIDFSPFQQLRASLATPREKQGLILNKKPSEDMTVVNNITVAQGSKFLFFKPFEARGALQFTGPIANPKLDITADYTGRQIENGTDLTKEYVVTVRITGTVNQPQIDLRYQFVGDNTTPTPTDRETQQRNAIALLLFGRTIEQLGSTSLGEQVGNVAGTFGESGLSIVSSTLSNILSGGTGFIRSVDITGSATDIGQARVNLVSQFGKVVVRAGGRVSNPTADGTVTVDLPFDILFDNEALNNLGLQLERAAQSTQSSSISSATGEDRETYRVRLQYRVVW